MDKISNAAVLAAGEGVEQAEGNLTHHVQRTTTCRKISDSYSRWPSILWAWDSRLGLYSTKMRAAA